MVFSSELIVFFVSAVIMAFLLAATWSKKANSLGKAFHILIILAFIWTVSYLVELASTDIDVKLISAGIQTLAAALMPVVLLNFVFIQYSSARLCRLTKYLTIIPLVSILIMCAVPRPNWFWGEPSILPGSAGLLLLDYKYGFWFYCIQMPYTFLLLFTAIVMLAVNVRKTHIMYKMQIISMLLAIILPATAGLLYVVNLTSINYTSAAFSISCLILFWSLFRYNFLDVIPKARYMIVEDMIDGVIVLDSKKRILDMNPSAMKIAGLSKSYVGNFISCINSDISLKISGMLDKNERCEEIKITSSNTGRIRVYEIRISEIVEKSGKSNGNIVTISDSTEKAEIFTRIYEQSIRDELTGIYNRRYVYEQGLKEIHRMKRNKNSSISVLVIDIDKMKMINDLYGHMTGDLVLVGFAESSTKFIRISDIFGRIGGDEFALILPDTETEEASGIAQRIIDKGRNAMIPIGDDSYISVNVSIGLICSESLNPDEVSIDNMLKIADDYMYRAKKQGGNRVLHPNINTREGS
jgi:diguanylate cyclase (GGDEF)-like protein/PAS domain S-box-containing protein